MPRNELETPAGELKRHGRMADHPVIAGTRTLRLFGLGTGRSALLWLSACLVFLLGSSELAAANVAETLFVKRVGPTALPLAFIAEGILVLLALNYVGAAVDRGRRIETLRTLLIAAAATPLVLRALILLAPDQPIVYGLLFAVTEALAIVLTLTVGALVVDLAPGPGGRTVAATVVGAGLLGEAFGSLLSAPIAAVLGVETALVLASFFAIAAGVLLTRIADRMLIRLDVIRAPKLGAPSARAALTHASEVARSALSAGRRSVLLRFLLAMTVVGTLITPLIDLQFHVAANETFGTEIDLLSFYALLKGLLTLVALGLQLVSFRWLRRRAGVAGTVVVVPFATTVAILMVLGTGGLLALASLWSVLRLGSASLDTPAREFLEELFPTELRHRVDWLVHRTGRAVALIVGSLLLLAVYELGGMGPVAGAALLAAATWLALTLVFRTRYGRLVLQTSLMNRVDFDALRPESVSAFLDRDAVRQLEREVVSGVPARAQLAIELLRQVQDVRLPLILAASYLRQPPVLRPLFLSTIQQALREAPQNWPGLRPTLAAVSRLARSRLTGTERAVLIRVYGEAAARHALDRREVADFLATASGDEANVVRLAVAGAHYRLVLADGGPAVAAAAAALNEVLSSALASSDEQDIHLAVSEIEELVRFDPRQNRDFLSRLLVLLEDPGGTTRVRAHVVGSVARLSPTIDADLRVHFDYQIVPLSLDADPRLAAAALEYIRDARYLPLLDTHVLPNLTAGNHHVRECAAAVVRLFGEAAVPVLLDVVRSGSRRERVAVSRLLGSYPIARPAHRTLIVDEMRGLARQLTFIQMLNGAEQPAPYAMLAARLEEESQEHVRAILRLLYADSGDETLTRIERQLWSRDSVLRTAALEALDHVARTYPETARLRRMVDEAPLSERVREISDLVPDPPTSLNELLRRCAHDGNWVTRLVTCHTIGAVAVERHGHGLDGNDDDLAEVLSGLAMEHRATLRQEAERAWHKMKDETLPEDAPMTTVERMLMLKETELFRNLDARDLAGIAGVLRELRYTVGETVMREGDRGDFLAIIAEGKVDITKGDGRGGQVHIRTLGKSNVIGEIALLEEGPRSASVVAHEQCHVAILGRAEFEALIEEYPGVALGLARVLSGRLQTMTAQAAQR
jgi:CRP/FNR family cyclic AMP-dependent transcriptional regulator